MSQLLLLIVINIGFGFAVGGIDNAAHLGGLFAGLWLGGLIPPSGVPTLATMWLRPATGPRPTSVGAAALATAAPPTARRVTTPRALTWLGVGVVAIVVIVGVLIGTPSWIDVHIGGLVVSASLSGPSPSLASLISGASARRRVLAPRLDRGDQRQVDLGLADRGHQPRAAHPVADRAADLGQAQRDPAIAEERDQLAEHVDGRDVEVGGRAQVEDHGLRRRLGRADHRDDLVLGDVRVHERQRDVRAEDEDAGHLARARVA